MDRDHYGARRAAGGLHRYAPDDRSMQIHLVPPQGCGVPHPKTGIDTQREQYTHFTLRGSADGTQFVDGEFPARLRGGMFAANLCPGVHCDACLLGEHSPDQLKQTDMLVERGRADILLQVRRVFAGQVGRHIRECFDFGSALGPSRKGIVL